MNQEGRTDVLRGKMIKNKAFEFRIYPDKAQRERIAKTFGCTRLVYNHYLAEKKKRYEESKTTLSYTDCANDMTRLKKEKTFLKSANKKSSTF